MIFTDKKVIFIVRNKAHNAGIMATLKSTIEKNFAKFLNAFWESFEHIILT